MEPREVILPMTLHTSVLLDEAMDALSLKNDGTYLDMTFGRGGHSQEILNRLGDEGRLFGLDQDPSAAQYAQTHFSHDHRFTFIQASFADVGSLLKPYLQGKKLDGVLMDLGVSSPQLDDPSRGFSFQQDGPLDMRMNPAQGMDAATWINHASEKDIAEVLFTYGEERFSRRIAKGILAARSIEPITRTKQLAKIVSDNIPVKELHKNPATRSFQAIRIFINRELEVLSQGLAQGVDLLAPNGRIVVISFHSLEDRIVKRFFKAHSRCQVPKEIPMSSQDMEMNFQVIGRAIKASEAEKQQNPRARSAVMRIGEKIK